MKYLSSTGLNWMHVTASWKSINNAISKVQGKEEKDLC
jgi:hypothetical protein